MLYAPSDVHSITVGTGCGEPHTASDTWPAERMAIDCPMCELALHPSLGWSPNPETAAQTCDERAQAEREEAAANKAGRKRLAYGSDASSEAIAALVVQNQTLMAQIAELTAALSAKVADEPQDTAAKATKAVKTAAKTGA